MVTTFSTVIFVMITPVSSGAVQKSCPTPSPAIAIASRMGHRSRRTPKNAAQLTQSRLICMTATL
jgi:hypothetical protein